MNLNCKKFETISAKTLFGYMGRENCVIVDLRDSDEYMQEHVEGAVNIPYERFDIGQFKDVDMDSEIIFYCDRGGVSMKAARELSCLGYKTKTVVGGYNAVSSYKNKMSGLRENKKY